MEMEGKREVIYLSLNCHHQNDSCIKMGSDESHFNVSLIVRDKVTRQCPQTTTFSKRKESRSGIEPRSYCLLVTLLRGHSLSPRSCPPTLSRPPKGLGTTGLIRL